MRCIRHKVHIALFIAFGLADLAWILQLMCQVRNYPKTRFIYQFMFNCAQNIIEKNMIDIVSLYCASWVATRLFHLTSFYWMFIEGRNVFSINELLRFVAGFYLFLRVQFPLSLTEIRYKHFTIFGWGKLLFILDSSFE